MFRSSFSRRPAILGSCILLIAMLLSLTISPQVVFAQSSTVSINPTQGSAGSQVTGTGSNWTAGDQMQVSWADDGSILANTTVQSNGTFTVGFKTSSNAGQGGHNIYFTDLTSRYFLTAVFTVTANTPTVIVQKVYTADSNNNAKTAFAPGDPIHYMWEAQNTSSTSVTATVTYRATGPQQIYYWSGSASLASGPLRYYSAPTIPATAPAGTYTITVTVTYNGVSSSGQSQFMVATSTPTWSYDPGNYRGKSSSVSVGDNREPYGSKYYNYCGPGASQVLISAWTANVPSIQTLAAQEQTNQGKVGTYLQDMVGPINSAIGQSYYSVHYAGRLQKNFSNMIGQDILDNHHPLITGLLTIYGNNHLYGWSYVSAPHIITITGFDFTSPTQGWIYYTETASAGAGATHGPGRYHLDYNTFWSLVQQNNIQLS
jgi:hypothetical protein